jgi:molybdopterin converting factor subunit 1
MITVRVKLFANVKDIVGSGEMDLKLSDGADISEIFQELAIRAPGVQFWKGHLRFAVNREYVTGKRTLNNGDEVAVIPPVSGG